MKVIIAGSRDISISNPNNLFDTIFSSIDWDVREVVSGAARGVDTWGEHWAKAAYLPVTQFKPDWNLGRGAGYRRNTEMAQYADALLAIWDTKSRGTKHMFGEMKRLGKPFQVWIPNREGGFCLAEKG